MYCWTHLILIVVVSVEHLLLSCPLYNHRRHLLDISSGLLSCLSPPPRYVWHGMESEDDEKFSEVHRTLVWFAFLSWAYVNYNKSVQSFTRGPNCLGQNSLGQIRAEFGTQSSNTSLSFLVIYLLQIVVSGNTFNVGLTKWRCFNLRRPRIGTIFVCSQCDDDGNFVSSVLNRQHRAQRISYYKQPGNWYLDLRWQGW